MSTRPHSLPLSCGLVLALSALGAGALAPSHAHGQVAEAEAPDPVAARTTAVDEPAQAEAAATTSPQTEDPAPAQPAPDAGRGAVRVSVAPTIDDAALFPQWIAERNANAKQRLALPDHEQWIAVEISGATYDYRVTVVAYRDGDVVGATSEPVVCECTSEALLDMADKEIARAVAELQATPVETIAPEPDLEPTPEPEPDPTPDPEPRKRLGRLGVSGIIVGAVGVGAVGGGIAMVIVADEDTSSYPGWLERDYRPPGYAVLSVGVAALASGATMLALDLTRCKRRPNARGCSGANAQARAGASGRHLQLSAAVSPAEAGLTLRGRF